MIDWTRVTVLRDEVGAEDFGEVVELFLDEVEETVARLSSNPDTATIEEDLHFLKGSALNLGFSNFSDLCQMGESMAAEGRAAEVDLAPILACYASSKATFMQEMRAQLAA